MSFFKGVVIWLVVQLVMIGAFEGEEAWYMDNHVRPSWCDSKPPYAADVVIGMLTPLGFFAPQGGACK